MEGEKLVGMQVYHARTGGCAQSVDGKALEAIAVEHGRATVCIDAITI